MRCEACRELLAGLAEGLLGDAERRRVDAHLAGCPGCQAELGSLRHAVSWLRADVSLEPPPGLCADVMRRIEASGPPGGTRQTPPGAPKTPPPVPAGWTASAWLVAGLAGGLAVTAAVLFVAPSTPAGDPSVGVTVTLTDQRQEPNTSSGSPPSTGTANAPSPAEEAGRSSGTSAGGSTASGQGRSVKPETAPQTAPVASPPASPRAPMVPAASELGLAARPSTATRPAAAATTATPPRTGPASPTAPGPGPVRTIGDGF